MKGVEKGKGGKKRWEEDQGEWGGAGSPYQMAPGHWDGITVTFWKTGGARTHLTRDVQAGPLGPPTFLTISAVSLLASLHPHMGAAAPGAGQVECDGSIIECAGRISGWMGQPQVPFHHLGFISPSALEPTEQSRVGPLQEGIWQGGISDHLHFPKYILSKLSSTLNLCL